MAKDPSNWQLQTYLVAAWEDLTKNQVGLLTAARGVDTKDLDEASAFISAEASRISLLPLRSQSSPADFQAQVNAKKTSKKL